jgi:hypothetical protein
MDGVPLARMLEDPNPWHFRQFLAGMKRQPEPVPIFKDSLDGAAPTFVRLRALWCLHASGHADVDLLNPLLSDREEALRVWAIRLLSDAWPLDDAAGRSRASRPTPDSLGARFLDMARQDESAMVRLALASLLQRLPLSERPALARALMSHGKDAADHNLPAMVWCALTPLVSGNPMALAGLADGPLWPPVAEWLARALLQSSTGTHKALDAFLGTARRADAPVRRAIVAGMAAGSRGWHRAPEPASWQEFAATLGHIGAGRLDVRPLITGRIGLAEVGQAFKDLASPETHAKILVEPWR